MAVGGLEGSSQTTYKVVVEFDCCMDSSLTEPPPTELSGAWTKLAHGRHLGHHGGDGRASRGASGRGEGVVLYRRPVKLFAVEQPYPARPQASSVRGD